MPREILLIEDNPGDVRLMREALREVRPAVELQVVSDGDEAIRYLRREGQYERATKPNLIFMDFNLPKSEGREILRQLKADQQLRAIPIAVLTTSDADRDIREAYQLYANCYLRKPVDLDSFISTVHAAVHFWLDVAFTPN